MSKNILRLVTFALLAGCSSSKSTATTPAGGVTTPADFQSTLDAYTCAWEVKCGYIGASEQKTCESQSSTSRAQYPSGYDQVEAANGKRLSFDATAAGQCLDAAKALGCTMDEQFGLSDTCAAVYKASVALGGACKADGECVAGYCDQGAGVATDGCAGTCTAFLASGATCDPNTSHCAASDYCDSTSTKCTARVGSGSACGDTLASCQSGLFCKGYVAASGTTPATPGACAGLGKIGDACTAYFFGNTDCTPGLFCDQSTATPTCKARSAAGADCSSLDECGDGLSCAGLVEDSTTGAVTTKGKCSAYLDVNGTCANPTAYETGCPYDTMCDATSKLCAPYGVAAADCGDSGTQGYCGNYLYCDASSKCSAQVALGAACTPPATTSDPDPCNAGSCDATSKTCVLVCK